jgi:hypothetical protein
MSFRKTGELSTKDIETVGMMSLYGGSFVRTLAELACRADAPNLEKIKATWPEYWSKYEVLAHIKNIGEPPEPPE